MRPPHFEDGFEWNGFARLPRGLSAIRERDAIQLNPPRPSADHRILPLGFDRDVAESHILNHRLRISLHDHRPAAADAEMGKIDLTQMR